MAKLTITLEDMPDGTMSFKVESDPPLPGPAASVEAKANVTAAQHIGMQLASAMMGDIVAGGGSATLPSGEDLPVLKTIPVTDEMEGGD